MLRVLTAFYVALVAIVIFYILYLQDINEIFKRVQVFWGSSVIDASQKMYTEKELSRYNGAPGSRGLYLAILGQVFDVEKGAKHYGPDGSYNVFAGRDASKAFITGEFENLIDNDVLTLEDKDIIALRSWLGFYYQEYKFVGRLIGQFYDSKGHETVYLEQFEQKVIEAELKEKENKRLVKQYPACNIEWSEGVGTKYWCSNKSGGQQRDWVGFPRQIFDPNANTQRCICVQSPSVSATQYKKYENCDDSSEVCFVSS
uniref:Putative heme/steroid binding protein n=1 Tax=Xenopsylla cheopis TaxID=163159 RepID=A0A6M2DF14_XENCH